MVRKSRLKLLADLEKSMSVFVNPITLFICGVSKDVNTGNLIRN